LVVLFIGLVSLLNAESKVNNNKWDSTSASKKAWNKKGYKTEGKKGLKKNRNKGKRFTKKNSKTHSLKKIKSNTKWVVTKALLAAESELVNELAKSPTERRNLIKAFKVLKRWARNPELVYKREFARLQQERNDNAAQTLGVMDFLKSAGNSIKNTVKKGVQVIKQETGKVKEFFDPSVPRYNGPFYKGQYKSWMSDMQKYIGNIPLQNIVMPGTHDSLTQDISAVSAIAPNSEETIAKIAKVLKYYPEYVFKSVVAAWAKAQTKTAGQQLLDGIRYLDLRVCKDKSAPKGSEKMLQTCHTLFSGGIGSALREISAFLDSNKKEIVILDFNHLYEMGASDHKYLFELVKKTIGTERIMSSKNFTSLSTPNEIWRSKQRVVILYGDDGTVSDSKGLFWSQSSINSPWPNVQQSSPKSCQLGQQQ